MSGENHPQEAMSAPSVYVTDYDRAACKAGVVHLGFGAFHRAHQAVYFDDYMQLTGDLRWGIAAVNLRASEAEAFGETQDDIHRHDGYFLQSHAANAPVQRRRVRSHVRFADWSQSRSQAEDLLSQPSVKLVTVTVTESGYYTDPSGVLRLTDPTIQAELDSGVPRSIYAYLRAALAKRSARSALPLTIACCDNIRQNGAMLRRNLLHYLQACGDGALAQWVDAEVAFPCSMVDRITPRCPAALPTELSQLFGSTVRSPILAESFTQWVLQSCSAAELPELERVGVTVTDDVDPFEEIKIRILNGGHISLAYLAALQGLQTFDAAMRSPTLLQHFERFQTGEVLPALTVELPFSKEHYLQSVIERFRNTAIADSVARICADGMAKFPLFIKPTLEGCLRLGIAPTYSCKSIASWYVFARHVDAGKIDFDYIEPSWHELKASLDIDRFVVNRRLWGELPTQYPEFAALLRQEIEIMEQTWPV